MSHVSDPSSQFSAITPSDTVAITGGPTRSIYVGGAGNITALNESGIAVLFIAVPAGSVLPVITTRVNATGTTATALVKL